MKPFLIFVLFANLKAVARHGFDTTVPPNLVSAVVTSQKDNPKVSGTQRSASTTEGIILS